MNLFPSMPLGFCRVVITKPCLGTCVLHSSVKCFEKRKSPRPASQGNAFTGWCLFQIHFMLPFPPPFPFVYIHELEKTFRLGAIYLLGQGLSFNFSALNLHSEGRNWRPGGRWRRVQIFFKKKQHHDGGFLLLFLKKEKERKKSNSIEPKHMPLLVSLLRQSFWSFNLPEKKSFSAPPWQQLGLATFDSEFINWSHPFPDN